MDRILIRGLKIFAYHGVNPEEKDNGQYFIFDITCSVDTSAASETDDIETTVSYAKVIKETIRIFTAEKYNLIETAAKKVADGIMEKFEKIQNVTVLLKKPEAPVKADFDYVAVEITVNRS